MFRNYFLVSYGHHKCLCPIFKNLLANDDVSIALKNSFQCVFKQGKGGNSKNETLSFWNRAIYQTAPKRR